MESSLIVLEIEGIRHSDCFVSWNGGFSNFNVGLLCIWYFGQYQIFVFRNIFINSMIQVLTHICIVNFDINAFIQCLISRCTALGGGMVLPFYAICEFFFCFIFWRLWKVTTCHSCSLTGFLHSFDISGVSLASSCIQAVGDWDVQFASGILSFCSLCRVYPPLIDNLLLELPYENMCFNQIPKSTLTHVRAYRPLRVEDAQISVLTRLPNLLGVFDRMMWPQHSVGNSGRRIQISEQLSLGEDATKFGRHFLTDRKAPLMNHGPFCIAMTIFSSFMNLTMKQSLSRSMSINSSLGFHSCLSLCLRYS